MGVTSSFCGKKDEVDIKRREEVFEDLDMHIYIPFKSCCPSLLVSSLVTFSHFSLSLRPLFFGYTIPDYPRIPHYGFCDEFLFQHRSSFTG